MSTAASAGRKILSLALWTRNDYWPGTGVLTGPGLGNKELGGYPGLLLDLDAWGTRKNVACLTCLHPPSSKAAHRQWEPLRPLELYLTEPHSPSRGDVRSERGATCPGCAQHKGHSEIVTLLVRSPGLHLRGLSGPRQADPKCAQVRKGETQEEEQLRSNCRKALKPGFRRMTDQSGQRTPNHSKKAPRDHPIQVLHITGKIRDPGSRRVWSTLHEGRAVAEQEPGSKSWATPVPALGGSSQLPSQGQVTAPPGSLQLLVCKRRASLRVCPPWKHFHPICTSYLLLCKKPTKWIKTIYIYYITLSWGRSLGTAFPGSSGWSLTRLQSQY